MVFLMHSKRIAKLSYQISTTMNTIQYLTKSQDINLILKLKIEILAT